MDDTCSGFYGVVVGGQVTATFERWDEADLEACRQRGKLVAVVVDDDGEQTIVE